jgi:NAD(P)-dependent dehydrogenase (short-subunit alcohol dehydrogenase family)
MRQRSHKTWFITGSSSGFGRALTETLLERGNRVAATLRKVNALDDLKEQYGERIWVAPLDVTDTTAVRAVVERAFDHMGRIDVVVNNAGYGLFGAAEEVSDDQIRRQIDTNLIGSIQVIRAALPSSCSGRRPNLTAVVSGRPDHLSKFQPVSHNQVGD